jgi:hypothetical protein
MKITKLFTTSVLLYFVLFAHAAFGQSAATATTTGNVTGVVAVANGGTGSAPQNFIDLTTNQTATGNKTFTGTLSGDVVNAATQYNIGGNRVLSVAGTNNLFAGVGAGQANTTGGVNSFFGNLVGSSSIIDDSNTFFGTGAGSSNTELGNYNSFFGNNAGQANKQGSANSFFGALAGASNTFGGFNSFFGSGAGKANTSGANNSFFGNAAGLSNTTGYFNSFFGHHAGLANTTGKNNSFFGDEAGIANTTGFNNSFFGRDAGMVNTEGVANSFFGSFVGQANTTGAYNSFFGESAGFSNTTGTNNTIIGRNANVGLGNLINATAIGAGSIVSRSDSLVLGSTGTNVGIGTNAPSTRLHIAQNSGNILFGNGGCNAGFAGLGFASTLTCSNYSVLGNGTDTIINRPTGGAIAFRENNADQMTISPGGVVAITTLGAAGSTSLCRNASKQISTCSSSLRYKTNIGRFSSGLSFVNQLRPISFDWKDGGMKDVGFGAEDIAKIDPRFVTYNTKGEVEGVKYDRLSVAFVNAFKEQQEQIGQQQKQLQRQQSEIEALKVKVSEVEALKQIVCSLKPDAAICVVKETKP